MVTLALLAACSEYKLEGPEPPVELPTEETTPVVTEPTEPVVDTTPPIETDTGTFPTDPVPEPVAEAPVYANTSGELFEIDPITGARTRVGAFQERGVAIDGMVDIAIDLTGRIYGGTYDAIYQIDALTAAVSKVCDTDLRPYALAFTSDGALFAGAGSDVVEIDLATCQAHSLLSGSVYETSGDLVGLPDGYLYWTVRGVDSDELVRVDPMTGATFWVGTIAEEKLFGLGYTDGELYGFSSLGSIVVIDPATAATTVLSNDGTSWWGATTNPVVW